MASPQCDWKPACARPAASGHHWCKEHKAEYQRTFRSTQEEMAAGRNFQAGVNAFRTQVARVFARCPGAQFEGRSIAEWIMEFPAPTLNEEPAPNPPAPAPQTIPQ